MPGGLTSKLGLLPYYSPTYSFEVGFLSEADRLQWLMCGLLGSSCVYLPALELQTVSTMPGFSVGAGDWNWGLMLAY